MIAVYGSGSPIMPAATMPSSRSELEQLPEPLARLGDGAAVHVLLRHDDDEPARALVGQLP